LSSWLISRVSKVGQKKVLGLEALKMGWFEREQREIVVIDPNLSPMDYLLARMRDPTTEEHTRTRIAIALLPFTVPKLSATASIPFDETMARLLDRARERSARVRVIDAPARPAPEPKPSPVEINPIFRHVWIDDIAVINIGPRPANMRRRWPFNDGHV
jgi:hypothetical protein